MIDFQFRVIGGEFYPQLKVKSIVDALNAVLFVIKDLGLDKDWYLSILSSEEGSQKFPNLHLQRVGGYFFFQIFASEDWSPDGEEGWFTMVGNHRELDHDPFCLTDDLPESSHSYFETGFSPDISFSKFFLTNQSNVETAIKCFLTSKQADWLKTGQWTNLGLI